MARQRGARDRPGAGARGILAQSCRPDRRESHGQRPQDRWAAAFRWRLHGPTGVEGALGVLGSDAPIAFAELAPNAADAGALGEARRQNRHRAIVVITRGALPGFCPSNADSFLRPFGPPVLQVASEEASFLADCAREGAKAVLTAHAERTEAQAFNVVASVSGSNSGAAPLVVMTPRSGWWSCASERGGGSGLLAGDHARRARRQAGQRRSVRCFQRS